MRRAANVVLLLLLSASSVFILGMGAAPKDGAQGPGSKDAVGAALAAGMPVFVDVGSTHCKPCREMAPTLDALKKKYEGRMEVVFVDVEKERVYARSLGVTMIPTQILYDKTGGEFTRHVGFLSMEDAEGLIKKMGI